ncbi:MAG: hypothetical protein JXA54_15965 [Candidatus Heimdallarchaeota archaeon]|nr:hypothetical protein [Candidatus Heimdallarchaeota archaeon]
MSTKEIPLIFKIQKYIIRVFFLEILFLLLGIIMIIFGSIGLRNQDSALYILLPLGILFLIVPVPLNYFFYPNYPTYIKIRKLFIKKDETTLINIAQNKNVNTIVVLIALYDLKTYEFKTLYLKHISSISSIKSKNNLEYFLKEKIVNEEYAQM